MTKWIKVLLFVIVGVILLYFIWLKLPVKFNRIQDINKGNYLIEKIENYRIKTNKLPDENDWEVLKELGFKEKDLETANPEYSKINDSIYELIFIEGFDGPYLLWNSNDKIWKKDNPSIPDSWKEKNKN